MKSWSRPLRGIVAVLLCLVAGMSEAATQEVGKIIAAIGTVNVVRVESGKSESLSVNSLIYLNDTIKTADDGRAKVLLSDDSILKVAPSSELQVSSMVAGTSEDKTVVNLLKGRLRSVIGKKLGPQASYEIRTAVAVAGVRGTDFEVMTVSGGQTAIRCFEGKVAVLNIGPGVTEMVLLTPNTFTTINTGKAPGKPQPIGPDESLPDKVGAGTGQQAREATEEDIEQLLAVAEEQLINAYEKLDLDETSDAGFFVFTDLGLEGGYVYIPIKKLAPYLDALINEQINGDVTDSQIDTITEPQLPGSDIQIDIGIPLP